MVDAQDEGGEAAHQMGSFQAANAPNARGEGLTRPGNDTVAASSGVVSSATVSEKLSDTQNSTPVPTTELPQVAEGSAQSEGANLAAPPQSAQQQSTNTSRSNSANPPAQDAASGSKPYGTRSRNTRGAARPNYAEQDADTEFEMGQATANGHTSRDVQRGRAVGESEESSAPGGKKGQPAVTGTWGGVKEPQPIPGTSSFSANPNVNSAPQPSRKRKAPGKDVVQTGVAQHSTPTIQTHTRRATAPSTDYSGRITNMLTFEKSGARLNQHWRLEADDDTQLSVNGKLSKFHLSQKEALASSTGRQRSLYKVTDFGRPCLSGVRAAWGAVLSGSHHGVFAHQRGRQELPSGFHADQLVLQAPRCDAIQQRHATSIWHHAFGHLPDHFFKR